MVTAHCIEMVRLDCRIVLSLDARLFSFSLVCVMMELLWILLRGVQILIALLAALISDLLVLVIVSSKLLNVR